MRESASLAQLAGAVLIGVGLVTGGGVAPARAADVPADLPSDSADDLLAKAPQIEEGSGWYLRGDVGYVLNESPDGVRSGFPPAGGTDMGEGWLFGVGVGVRLNDWLRVDLTADYRTEADYRLAGRGGELSAFTTLANAYVDLGSWHGLTPYVGAGAGAGYLSLSDAAFPAGRGDGDGWGFAWALMAGVSVELSPRWVADIGYRYIAIDSADLGGSWGTLSQNASEFRVGVRFLFD